jgi:hypothetical protein
VGEPRLLFAGRRGLNEAEAREMSSWRKSEIYLIEPWIEE